MHTPDPIAQAHATLDVLLEAVLAHPQTGAKPEGYGIARASIGMLHAVLDMPPAINPDYTPMPRMTAALIALFTLDADAWHRLVENAIPKGNAATGTLAGLVALTNLVRLIGDDHDLALDPSSRTPKLVAQDSLPPNTPTATPRSLLAAFGYRD